MKKGLWMLGMAAIVLSLTLLGCQTTGPVTSENIIQTEQTGLAPNGDKQHSTIDFSFFSPNRDSIKSWKVEMVTGSGTQKMWSGDKNDLPQTLTWDGRNEAGALAPEGTYTAKLTVDYGAESPVTAQSIAFILDISPPSGSVSSNPGLFTPDSSGSVQPVAISITGNSAVAKMDSWSLDILNQNGKVFRSFDGKWPSKEIHWDGKSAIGDWVEPGQSYTAEATLRDEFGNLARVHLSIAVSNLPPAQAPQTFGITPGSRGFSPTSDTVVMNTMNLALSFGPRGSVNSWKVEILDSNEQVQKTFNGDGSNLPPTVNWDGKTDAGSLGAEGTYTARLSVEYGSAFMPGSTRSTPFLLDITPPGANVSVNPAKLEGDGRGGIQPVTFTLYGNSTSAVLKGWTLNVVDAGGKTEASFEGAWPPAPPVWNGALAGGGGKANPTKEYRYVARIRDEFGNVGEARGSLATGELPVVQGVLSVTPNANGFSPNGDHATDAMVLAVAYGQPSAVTTWSVSVGSPASGVVKTYSGDATDLPGTLSWDGKTDQGTLAAEGRYTATLSVSYGTVFAPASATSSSFVLSTTAPTGSISLSDPLFSPFEESSTITLTIAASSKLAAIDSWRMEIYDPEDHLFKTFEAKWPTRSAVWDGKGFAGDLVLSAEDYPVVVKVRDEFGNVGELKSAVPVDILMEKTATGYLIRSSRIFFKPYTADYRDVKPELAAQNLKRLADMAAKLKKFPNYKIKLVGHAVSVYWDNKARSEKEQMEDLLPLSKARAEAVREALVEKGLTDSTFTTVGVGDADQLVPDSDLINRWQNRRVAFFLDK